MIPIAGAVDVLSASSNDNKVVWYKSDGAATPTFTANLISSSASGACCVHAVDVDSDGDVDVLAGT